MTRLSILAIFLTWTVAAQTAQAPVFEVATIKPAAPNQPGFGINFGRGMMRVNNVTLRQAILYAYDLHDYQLSGGPKWASSEAFDIVGKAPEANTPPAALHAMLRALLADRFQLRLRKEMKPLPAYSLNVAKGGLKLGKAAAGEPFGTSSGAGRMKATALTMPAIASLIASSVGKPVVDRTEAEGLFNFEVHFAAENSPADTPQPSLFTALQEQCGLKLEATTAPGETYAIEQAAKPSAN